MTEFNIGLGPMSLEIIDSIIDYSNDYNKKIMLIASRNQIECGKLGNGYVNDFSTENFIKYVKAKDSKNIIICRDHSGPYLYHKEIGLSEDKALESTLISLEEDVKHGMDLIHIDPSETKNPYDTAKIMFEHVKDLQKKYNRTVEFEFGSEENIGVAASKEKLIADLEFVTQYIKPKYIVGQTGSLVKSIYQVGKFNAEKTQELVNIAKNYGVILKEHNVDYSTSADIKLRKQIGVGAINIAPQLGYVQTKTLVELANYYRMYPELDWLKHETLLSNKWKKWEWGEFDDKQKFLSSAHYLYNHKVYMRLINWLKEYCDYKAVIKKNIYATIDEYLNA